MANLFHQVGQILHLPHVALSSACKTQRERAGAKQGAGRCDRSFARAEPCGGHDYGALGDPSALSLTPRCLVALFLAPSSSSSSAHSSIHFPVASPLRASVWPMLSQCFIRPPSPTRIRLDNALPDSPINKAVCLFTVARRAYSLRLFVRLLYLSGW